MGMKSILYVHSDIDECRQRILFFRKTIFGRALIFFASFIFSFVLAYISGYFDNRSILYVFLFALLSTPLSALLLFIVIFSKCYGGHVTSWSGIMSEYKLTYENQALYRISESGHVRKYTIKNGFKVVYKYGEVFVYSKYWIIYIPTNHMPVNDLRIFFDKISNDIKIIS